MKTLNSIDLDSVTGGNAQRQRLVRTAGEEALFCGGLAARAKKPAGGPGWTAARLDLAARCVENLVDNVTPRR